jgi:hypothetical protein
MNRKRSGAKPKVAHITGKRSARPAGKPGDFLLAKESLQRSLPRHFLLATFAASILSAQHAFSRQGGIYRSDVGSKRNQTLGRKPAASRWPAPWPGKRTRREDHALLIVRDEFRTGYSLIGLLASIARLRFTGTVRIALDSASEQDL